MAFVFENEPEWDRSSPPSSPELPFGPGQQILPAPLTELATRYGTAKNSIFYNTGKSAITPIHEPDLTILSPKSQKRAQTHERVQRQKLNDFATWELVESGSWIDNDVKYPNLDTVQIHALYQQNQWLAGNIPIGGNFTGVWEARNPVVWRLLVPILKLATILLHTSTELPWLDALLHGPRFIIPPSDMEAANRDGDIDYSFHTRPQKEFIQAVQSNYTHKWFEQLPNGLLLAIGSSKTATKCHIPQSGLDLIVGGDNGSGFTIGLSTNVNYKGSLRGGLRRIVSTLYYELLEPLLRDDLEASERLAQQYYFAVVLVHETMHAVALFQRELLPSIQIFEPFFEEEDIAELGYSWEKSMFTYGRISYLFQNSLKDCGQLNPPLLGLYVDGWPQWWEFRNSIRRSLKTTRRRRPQKYDIGASTTIWPLHISILESIHQRQFWDVVVRQQGIQALSPPRIIGRRHTKTEDAGAEALTVIGPQYEFWYSSTGQQPPSPSICATPTALEAYEHQQQTRIRADVVKTALRIQRTDSQVHQQDLHVVEEWEGRRRNNPIPITLPRDISEARLRIAVRTAKNQEVQNAMEAQSLTPQAAAMNYEENRRREILAQGMLEDAINLHVNGNIAEAVTRCGGILHIMKANIPLQNFLIARAYTLLGIMRAEECRTYLNAAIDIYRSFEVLNTPTVDNGSWRELSKEVKGFLNQLDEEQLHVVQREMNQQQEGIDNALKATWANYQQQAARLCVDLLKSNFTAIQAQAHLLLARLDKTQDRIQHAQEAVVRLNKLMERAPGVKDWATMKTAAIWVLDQPQPGSNVNDLGYDVQQVWVDNAPVLFSSGIHNNVVEAFNTCRVFAHSTSLSIRAQCHHHLAGMRAGDELFRRLEAFTALEDLEILRTGDPTNQKWVTMINSLHQFLGGSTSAEWEAAAMMMGEAMTMEHMVSTFGRIGEGP